MWSLVVNDLVEVLMISLEILVLMVCKIMGVLFILQSGVGAAISVLKYRILDGGAGLLR